MQLWQSRNKDHIWNSGPFSKHKFIHYLIYHYLKWNSPRQISWSHKYNLSLWVKIWAVRNVQPVRLIWEINALQWAFSQHITLLWPTKLLWYKKHAIVNWGILSFDGIPNGLADFFFFFSSFFRRRIWHARRLNTMKETCIDLVF